MLNKNSYLSAFQGEKSIFKAMKYYFFLKTDYKNKFNTYPIYLNLYIHGKRKRIPLDIFINEKDWNKTKQQISNPNLQDYNLILNDIKARINKIEIQFRLNEQVLNCR